MVTGESVPSVRSSEERRNRECRWVPEQKEEIMLGKADALPMIAVKDLDRARRFYEDKLGLETTDEWGGEGATMKSGDTLINVYKSEFAGTNQATALTFDVDDVEKEVNELKEKGIFFEQYDLPGLRKQGDLYVGEKGFKTAWF